MAATPNVTLRLLLDDVRSFAGHHDIPLSKITLLVGENSSGKTTFLAMLSAAMNPQFPEPRGLFNSAPFDLGNFDTIASYKGGRFGRAASFSVGLQDFQGDPIHTINATFRQRVGQTELAELSVSAGDEHAKFAVDGERIRGEARLLIEESSLETFSVDAELEPSGDIWFSFVRALLKQSQQGVGSPPGPETKGAFDRMYELFYRRRSLRPPIAIAPVRTKPHRTYDEVNDDFKPEGDHVPYLLARIRNDPSPKWDRLWEELDRFGADAGLYKKLTVKKLGPRPSDPFQVRVKTAGPTVNLPDVGYGVSQALPIVVESVQAAKRGVLLVQQPEVHLHPRAQAALGSFFVRMAKEDDKQFIVETHSDYLVDRIRMEVAAGAIKYSDVSILFFDRQHVDTTVHVLGIDRTGNITNAPSNFRSFFLKEELRLLNRGT